jgi:hypothetical protein
VFSIIVIISFIFVDLRKNSFIYFHFVAWLKHIHILESTMLTLSFFFFLEREMTSS